MKISVRHFWFGLATLALVLLLLYYLLVEGLMNWPPWCRTCYATAEDAVRAGQLDPDVLQTLRNDGQAQALIVLAVKPLEVAYRPDENPAYSRRKALEQYTTRLAQARRSFSALEIRMEPIRTYSLLPVEYVTLYSESVILKLLASGLVSGISANHENVLFSSANLSFTKANLTQTWGQRGAGVGVAVIDQPVDVTNSAFGSCSAAGPSCTAVPFAQNFPRTPSTTTSHGTNVAGVVLSVAPAARILSLGVENASGTIWDSDALSALNWVLQHHAQYNIRAVNMSFGVPNYYADTHCGVPWAFTRNAYQPVFTSLRALDILPVVSAGNDAAASGSFTNGVAYPACTLGAAAIGAIYDAPVGMASFSACSDATTAAGQPTCFSQSGSLLTLWAPGETITAAGISMSGTSQAAPHVAGAFAVLASADPMARVATLESALNRSGPLILDSRNNVTKPRLDVAAALTTLVPQPGNDNFANAQWLSGRQAALQQVNWTATREPGEPAHAANPGGASLWYRWQAPYTGPAHLDTIGSEIDTLLAVYQGGGVSALTLVGANDDVSGGSTASALDITVNQGSLYFIAVDGKCTSMGCANRGRIKLALNGSASNNEIATAKPLTSGVPVAGSNIGASKEAGEPYHCDNQGGASVWYVWSQLASPWNSPTVATRWTVRVPSSNFLLCVSVYQAATNPADVRAITKVGGGLWATRDNTWSAQFQAGANAYYIVVDGISSEDYLWSPAQQGTFTLIIEQNRQGPNWPWP